VSLDGSPRGSAVRIIAPAGKGWARVEVWREPQDRDPLLLVDVQMTSFGVLELTFVQICDPASERFGIDYDTEGQDTLFGTLTRNVAEEARAMAAGLAPGQVRRGRRLLGRVLQAVEEFSALLGNEVYLVEPLFYHSAILYERHGLGYLLGRETMEEIHREFQPGGPLQRRLDGSTAFRLPGAEGTVRGRSWAIHDGLLGEPWGGIKMYRVVGQQAGVETFSGGPY
jgi:acetoin utilization protein AcuC